MSLLKFVVDNNVRCTLAAGVSAGDSTMQFNVAAAPWRDFPTDVSNDNRGILTLVDSLSNPTKFEVVTYSGVTGPVDDVVTLIGVLRGLELTEPTDWSIGHYGFQAITAGSLAGPIKVISATGIRVGNTDAYTEIDAHYIALIFATVQQGFDTGATIVYDPDLDDYIPTELTIRFVDYASETTYITLVKIGKDGSFTAMKRLTAEENVLAGKVIGLTQLRVNTTDYEGIDWNVCAVQRLKLTGSTSYALTFTAPSELECADLMLIIRQPRGTYPVTVSWDPEVRWNLGEDPPSFDMAESELLGQYVDTVLRFRYVSGIYYAENLGRFGYFSE